MSTDRDPPSHPDVRGSDDRAAAVLHYTQEIFKGMKANKSVDGGVALFRPVENARRFARSGERMAMPIAPETLIAWRLERPDGARTVTALRDLEGEHGPSRYKLCWRQSRVRRCLSGDELAVRTGVAVRLLE